MSPDAKIQHLLVVTAIASLSPKKKFTCLLGWWQSTMTTLSLSSYSLSVLWRSWHLDEHICSCLHRKHVTGLNQVNFNWFQYFFRMTYKFYISVSHLSSIIMLLHFLDFFRSPPRYFETFGWHWWGIPHWVVDIGQESLNRAKDMGKRR